MNKIFQKLNVRILIDIAISVLISGLLYVLLSQLLIESFASYAEQPAVFKRLADKEFQSLQSYTKANNISASKGEDFTEWNDEHHYVSILIVRENEAMCYNSFVSYNMTYTEDDKETFHWGSKSLPVYTYALYFNNGECAKLVLSGYLDMVYSPLRKAICLGVFVLSFVSTFYLLFKRYIRYIAEIEDNVTLICNKKFDKEIEIKGSSELTSLACKINHMSDTIEMLLMGEEVKLQQQEQFVKSIAHDIRTPLTSIIGYLELLTNKERFNPKDNQKFISKALEKANHIKTLTDDLFSFEESYKRLVFEELDGNIFLVQFISSMFNYLKANDIDLRYTSNIESNFRLITNITLMMRLIDNICSNIIKHSDPSAPVDCLTYISDGFCIMEVRNKQVTSNSVQETTKSEGSGFGLLICKEIMSNLNGRIVVDQSNDDFCLTLYFKILNE